MPNSPAAPSPDRLRTPPAERFAGAAHSFDLQQALNDLRAEEHPARSGHRSVTIFGDGPVSNVLFAFDAGGSLGQHAANGFVTIHVLEGQLLVHAAGEPHLLGARQVLYLRPNIVHDVRADVRSAMLLTVHLQQGGSRGT